MNKLVVILVVIMLLTSCSSAAAENPVLQDTTQISSEVLAPSLPRGNIPPLLKCLYYEEEAFLQSVQGRANYQWEGKASGGIVPHHLLAGDMISGFFAAVASGKAEYERVVIFSTSHYPEDSGGRILTSTQSWLTPFGVLESDENFSGVLLADDTLKAVEKSSAIENDHGIAALIPYVKYYLPNTKIGVCLLPNKLSEAEVEAVKRLFVSSADSNTLVVGSVDFSHYLSPDESVIKDMETIKAIENFDTKTIANFTDDNADSPLILLSMLNLATENELTLTMLGHSSSPEKLGVAYSNQLFQDGITTYFTYVIV